MMENHDLLMELSDLAADMPVREFNNLVAGLYRFETPFGPVTKDEFLTMIGEGKGAAQRVYRLQIEEEIMVFSGYLRAASRNRALFAHLAAKMDQP